MVIGDFHPAVTDSRCWFPGTISLSYCLGAEIPRAMTELYIHSLLDGFPDHPRATGEIRYPRSSYTLSHFSNAELL